MYPPLSRNASDTSTLSAGDVEAMEGMLAQVLFEVQSGDIEVEDGVNGLAQIMTYISQGNIQGAREYWCDRTLSAFRIVP